MKIVRMLVLCSLLPCLYGVSKQKQTMVKQTKTIITTTTATKINTEKLRKINNSDNKNKKLLEIVEKKFLSFMGLSVKPEKGLKERIKVPEHLWKLYYKWSDDNFEDYNKNNADTARIIYHDVEKDHVMRSILSRLRFNLTGIDSKERIQSAELHLYHQGRKTLSKKSRVFKVLVSKNITNETNTEKEIISAKKIKSDKLGYVKLDVTKAVQKWSNNTVDSSLELHLEAGEAQLSLNDLHLRQRRDINEFEWHQKRPLLVIYTSSSDPQQQKQKHEINQQRRSRQKRNILHRTKNYKRLNETHERVRRETCRLHKYYLQFAEVGWDEWILQPPGYNINFCKGECPRPMGPHFNTTNHAVIQNTVLSLKKDLVPPLCCIPTDLKDQTFLHLDSMGKLVLKQPSQMVALGCGCR